MRPLTRPFTRALLRMKMPGTVSSAPARATRRRYGWAPRPLPAVATKK
jgi:hypothetical protein